MAESEASKIRVEKWLGQMSNADPHDLPPGAAQIQENVVSTTPGQLETRLGWRAVTFEN